MRSRYSAFALWLPAYLAATQRAPFDSTRSALRWVGLTVHHARGGADELTGEVEFTARYLAGDRLCALHERSSFEREGARWVYTTGAPDLTETKVQRNAPCPCGSGRKFKSCCA